MPAGISLYIRPADYGHAYSSAKAGMQSSERRRGLETMKSSAYKPETTT